LRRRADYCGLQAAKRSGTVGKVMNKPGSRAHLAAISAQISLAETKISAPRLIGKGINPDWH